MIYKDNKDAFLAAYKFYLEEDGTEKLIGIITEDGATLSLEGDTYELPNGHDGSIYGKWKWVKNGRVAFAINVFDYDTLALAIPGAETTSTKDGIKIKAKVVALHKHTKKFIARPEGFENDESKKITFYAAVNDNDFEMQFRHNQATIPFSLLCLKDEDGNFIDIGDPV